MKNTQNNLATMYFEKLKETEKVLGKERRKNKKLETENEKLKRKTEELEEENIRLKGDLDHEKDKTKMYSKMIFKENIKSEGKKMRGAQKGHMGVSRLKPAIELVQEKIDVKVEICPECGDALGGCKRKYTRIIEDILIQPQITITQYNIHQYNCKVCGEKITAKPHNAMFKTPFGKRTFAYILFQRYRLKTPIAKIVEALREVHGLNISEGGVKIILKQASIQFKD